MSPWVRCAACCGHPCLPVLVRRLLSANLKCSLMQGPLLLSLLHTCACLVCQPCDCRLTDVLAHARTQFEGRPFQFNCENQIA